MKTTTVAATTSSREAPRAASRPGISVSRRPRSTAVVTLSGEHDIATARSLEGTAGDELRSSNRLVVDLTETAFIDSSVINTLARLARQARSRGVVYQVVAPRGTHVRRVLELMGLEGHLGCVDAVPRLGIGRRNELDG